MNDKIIKTAGKTGSNVCKTINSLNRSAVAVTDKRTQKQETRRQLKPTETAVQRQQLA